MRKVFLKDVVMMFGDDVLCGGGRKMKDLKCVIDEYVWLKDVEY